MAQNHKKNTGVKILLVVLFLFLIFSCLTSTASATPPPSEQRIKYLLPNSNNDYNITMRSNDLVISSNQSTDDRFTTLDYVGPGMVYAYGNSSVTSGSSLPFFPEISQYWAYKHFIHLKTGETYVSQVWFFNDWTTFETKKEELYQYLQKHGQVSKVSLDISDELIQTNNSIFSGMKIHQYNVTRYVSKDTSGYFIVHENSWYPGLNCYIIYIGVKGQTDFQEPIHPLKMLFVSISPQLNTGNNYDLDPHAFARGPNDIDITPFLAIFIILVGGSAVIYWNKRRK